MTHTNRDFDTMNNTFINMPTQGYIIYRNGPSCDPTTPLQFYPSKESDELFFALKTAYPTATTHSERMRNAVIDFLMNERDAEGTRDHSDAFLSMAASTTLDSATTSPLSSWPSASTSSVHSSPGASALPTPAPAAVVSPTISCPSLSRQTSQACSDTPPAIDQMTSVFSLRPQAQLKTRVRRKMTEDEKVEYRKRRMVKACEKCSKRKRKCSHNVAQMDQASTRKPVQRASTTSIGKRPIVAEERESVLEPPETTSASAYPDDPLDYLNLDPMLGFSQYDNQPELFPWTDTQDWTLLDTPMFESQSPSHVTIPDQHHNQSPSNWNIIDSRASHDAVVAAFDDLSTVSPAVLQLNTDQQGYTQQDGMQGRLPGRTHREGDAASRPSLTDQLSANPELLYDTDRDDSEMILSTTSAEAINSVPSSQAEAYRTTVQGTLRDAANSQFGHIYPGQGTDFAGSRLSPGALSTRLAVMPSALRGDSLEGLLASGGWSPSTGRLTARTLRATGGPSAPTGLSARPTAIPSASSGVSPSGPLASEGCSPWTGRPGARTLSATGRLSSRRRGSSSESLFASGTLASSSGLYPQLGLLSTAGMQAMEEGPPAHAMNASAHPVSSEAAIGEFYARNPLHAKLLPISPLSSRSLESAPSQGRSQNSSDVIQAQHPQLLADTQAALPSQSGVRRFRARSASKGSSPAVASSSQLLASVYCPALVALLVQAYLQAMAKLQMDLLRSSGTCFSVGATSTSRMTAPCALVA